MEKNKLKAALLIILKGYKKYISPVLPGACRFYPTCSDYMAAAICEWGVMRGVYLGVRRLLRCHPFHPGGIDPVPLKGAPVRSNRRDS